jgi:hypothetical protein
MTMCLNAVRVAVEMNNFMHVTNYVSKADQTPGAKVRRGVPYLLPLVLKYQGARTAGWPHTTQLSFPDCRGPEAQLHQ